MLPLPKSCLYLMQKHTSPITQRQSKSPTPSVIWFALIYYYILEFIMSLLSSHITKPFFWHAFLHKVVPQVTVHRCTIRWKRQLNLWWDILSFVQLTSGQASSPQMHICPWGTTVPCSQGGRCCNMTACLQMDLLNEGHSAANIQEHIDQMVYFPIRQIWRTESQWRIVWLITPGIWSGPWLIMTTSIAWHIT